MDDGLSPRRLCDTEAPSPPLRPTPDNPLCYAAITGKVTTTTDTTLNFTKSVYTIVGVKAINSVCDTI